MLEDRRRTPGQVHCSSRSSIRIIVSAGASLEGRAAKQYLGAAPRHIGAASVPLVGPTLQRDATERHIGTPLDVEEAAVEAAVVEGRVVAACDGCCCRC